MASETICCSAELTVDRPRGPTLALFTAEGERASVTVIASEPTSTRVRVSYDLTALSPDGARRLTTFADEFAASISHWEAAIAAVGDELSGRPPSHTP